MKILFLIIFILLLLHYSYFLLKIIYGLARPAFSSYNNIQGIFISVIIPFRNESRNILNSLASIENQDYPDDLLEVIYVDDHSTDDSFYLIDKAVKKTNIKVVKLPDENPTTGNKKRAINYGIENCRGEIIVTTDADCVHHKGWLRSLSGCIDPETAFVSGPVGFLSELNFFTNIQKLEFEGLVLAGAGLIGTGRPVICNGANIAYKKSAYVESGGLNDSFDISSGDDALIMQKISKLKTGKVKFCTSKEAVVLTKSNGSIRDFFNQRKRWVSKSFNYSDINLIFQLILIFIFYCGLVLQLLLSIAGYHIFLFTLGISLIIKASLEYLIIKQGQKLFFTKSKFSVFFVSEILHVPYIIFTTIAGLTGHFTWKGRLIKR